MRHHQARLRWGALALVTLLALAASGCGGEDDGGDEATGDESTETTADAAAGTTAGGGAYGDEGDEDTTTAPDDGGEAGAVEVAGFEFTPGEIEVAVGEDVTWTNGDDTTHTVTADDAAFDHSLDGSGTSASQTFDEAGEFPYHCSIHESMTGTVVVAEG